MAIEVKGTHSVFGVHKLTTFTKTSQLVFPHNHFETGYSGKHSLIKDELYLYFFNVHITMPRIEKVTMVLTVSDVIDLSLPLCSSVIDCSGGSVKICCSDILCGWAASALYTCRVSLSVISAT